MKKMRLLLILATSLLASFNSFSQVTSLVCNDLVFIALEENCSVTVSSESILEGGPYFPWDHYIVEMDTVAPLGNGPWLPAVAGVNAIGKTYILRVTDPDTGNRCWGNAKFGTHVECDGLATVALNSGGKVTVSYSDIQNVVTLNDACFPANTLSLQSVDLVTYDCADLGVQILKLTANDQSGKTSICSVPVVVTDPLGACNNCVSCPPAVTVSFEQAVNTLLPALQSGNLDAFDIYGDPTYNNACNILDSTYSVTYHPTSNDLSWFDRHWVARDANSQIVGECQQPVLFIFEQNFMVNGTVYVDSIENCQLDPGESGFSLMQVVATKLPSNQKIVRSPNPDGTYSLNLFTHALDSIVDVQIILPDGVTTPCPTILSIPAATTTGAFTMDYGVRIDAFCAKPEVTLDAGGMRRCFPNNFYLQYSNSGLLPEPNAFITVAFDTLLQVTASSIPWSSVVNNTYTFPLGTLPPLSNNQFTITASLSCDAQLNQTICSEAHIYPHSRCDTAAWKGPHIETSARCNGDTVDLAIWNRGPEAMVAPLDFIVIEDVIMYRQGSFQLGAGDSMSIKMPANGSTWRIEAEQIPGNPEGDSPSSAIEGCGGLNTPGLVNAFPPNDDPLFSDIECREVVGSYDPNDKSAVPTGYGSDNIIRKNTDIEYTIRFQNTGTDTAFRVVVADTLSPLLDHSSVQAGVSSHPYRLDVYEGGVLRFAFDNILLPDSHINEPKSHGFVKFRVAQQANLAKGSEILNNAAIYFDFNDPVVTNTVRHTVGEPFIALSTSHSQLPGLELALMPHPLREYSVLQVKGKTFRQGLLLLYDLHGRLVQTQYFEGDQCRIERRDLGRGMYFFQVSEQGAPVASGKLEVF